MSEPYIAYICTINDIIYKLQAKSNTKFNWATNNLMVDPSFADSAIDILQINNKEDEITMLTKVCISYDKLRKVKRDLYNAIKSDVDFNNLMNKIEKSCVLKPAKNGYSNEQIDLYNDALSKYIYKEDFIKEEYVEAMVNLLPKATEKELKERLRGIRIEKIWYYFYKDFQAILKKYNSSVKLIKKLEQEILEWTNKLVKTFKDIKLKICNKYQIYF